MLKSDPTATVTVGATATLGVGSGASGGDGGFSQFSQTTGGIGCKALGGNGAIGTAGGAGGSAAGGIGSIKYSGGDGGDRDAADDGGGGGGNAGHIADGDPGQVGSAGGAGGADGDGIGAGGNGGNDGTNGQPGDPGGGGGGGTDGIGGLGSAASVSVCWEDPEITGYCVDDRCNNWWPRCGYYRYGRRCFYYGYGYDYPYLPYMRPGHPIECCGNAVIGNPLHLTITNHGVSGCSILATQTVDLVASDDGYYYAWIPEMSGYLRWDPAHCSRQLVCTWGVGAGIGTAFTVVSCSPLYLFAHAYGNPSSFCLPCTPSPSGSLTHTFEITE